MSNLLNPKIFFYIKKNNNNNNNNSFDMFLFIKANLFVMIKIVFVNSYIS